MVRAGAPPPPRPDFSPPQSNGNTGTASLRTRDEMPSELQVLGQNTKLPPFTSGPFNELRASTTGAADRLPRSPMTVPVHRVSTTTLSPHAPAPFYMVKESRRTLQRAPSAALHRRDHTEQTRKMIHSAPLPNSSIKLLEDLAEHVPRHLEGKAWYSELHKLKHRYDPRWHSAPRQDPRLKGNWTSLPISPGTTLGTQDMPQPPPTSQKGPLSPSVRKASARVRVSSGRMGGTSIRPDSGRGPSNWDSATAVLRSQGIRPSEPIDPVLQSLLVVDSKPSPAYKGYKRTEGRLEARLITAQYMREFYKHEDTLGKSRKKLQNAVLSNGQDTDDDVFARLEGGDIDRQWAEARMDKLYERAEMQWYELHGAEMESRIAQRAHRYAERHGQEMIPEEEEERLQREASSRMASSRSLMRSVSRGLGNDDPSPTELQKVKALMYASLSTEAKDLTAPEYYYYEDPSFGAFDTLVAEDSQYLMDLSQPVAEETAQSRLGKVMMRNRAASMASGQNGRTISSFVQAQTGLTKDVAQRLVEERISSKIVKDLDTSYTAAYHGKQVDTEGNRPAHSAHLAYERDYCLYRLVEEDDIQQVTGTH